ncbi:TonB-dependent receptor [Nitrospirillum sp. BR 11163]|uniref:TonB-dependent receptor n=1 Tax=Nitrospirillum sp. BR 11163 TaxID=3104323 RepID=UPI002AFDCA84|nr:TonB-dependent receptor [Nitrospirillum sp. BR 11163]MEA1673101.1 TonB-dependent receptor [Nitrospirillum sp. BR 11163]
MIDIPAGDLRTALESYIRQTGSQLIYKADEVAGISTKGAQGRLSAQQALDSILANTGLTVHRDPSGAAVVSRKSDRAATATPALRNAAAQGATAEGTAAQPQVAQATPATTGTDDTVQMGGAPDLQEIIVTGLRSKRNLLNASVAITAVNEADLAQKAPRSTVDVLEMIPGIFVEGTAGPVSNNYSVRGLPGGTQQFVRLIEDGMPAIYGGLNDDEVFQNDISIDRVEALQGGSSGILTPNAAGASINFISRKLNFDEAGGIARITGTTYGDRRGDLWFSSPIPDLKDTAFAISGYYDSTPGVRSSPFRYETYHVKGQLEHKFEDGWIRFTVKDWDEHDPYYADQPYAYNNGTISSVPGLDTQFGNIIGKGFANVSVPDSCYANGQCFRNFSMQDGIHATGHQFRVDGEREFDHGISLFVRGRYTETDWDFNGVFAGSGSGNGGLASALTYLTPTSASPIYDLLQSGLAAFPGTTQFGIRNLTNGQVTAASNAAALNALNGNGLLQQTVLNRQLVKLRDWGSDFGAKWDTSGDGWTNSLTVGGMIYATDIANDQSGVSTVINDVKNQSNIYDIVAMNSAGTVLGTLGNNGLISYGNWGAGISATHQTSKSVYVNDEFAWNQDLHFDFGVRYEREDTVGVAGNSSPQPIPAGVGGIVQVNPNAFNGTYSYTSGHELPVHVTAGVNYTIAQNLSVYARYARAYQTQGTNPQAAALSLYEGGVTYSDYGLTGTVRGFRTEFKNQTWGGGVNPADPNLNQGFFADSETNGVDVDLYYRPQYEPLSAFGVHAQATYQDPTFSNVKVGFIDVNGTNIAPQVAAFYNGKIPGRTPKILYAVTPEYNLPNNKGQIYLRYKYVGRIFADNGNQVELPGYGVVTIGAIYNLTPAMTLNVSVDNVTDELGLTEGNPRQGFTQQVVNGYFYGRGIVGPNAMVSLTAKF